MPSFKNFSFFQLQWTYMAGVCVLMFLSLLPTLLDAQERRRFREDSLENYRLDPSYAFGVEPSPPQEQPEQAKGSPQDAPPELGQMGKVLVYAILAIAFGLISYLLFRQFGNQRKKPRSLDASQVLDKVSLEEIRQTNFAKKALEAESKQDYRLAIRWNFLHVLQRLDKQKKIRWKKDKTNLDYSYEIQDQAERTGFEEAARIFDQAWYGNFPVDQESYMGIRSTYHTLLNDIT